MVGASSARAVRCASLSWIEGTGGGVGVLRYWISFRKVSCAEGIVLVRRRVETRGRALLVRQVAVDNDLSDNGV
jgi:hypothetical protein